MSTFLSPPFASLSLTTLLLMQLLFLIFSLHFCILSSTVLSCLFYIYKRMTTTSRLKHFIKTWTADHHPCMRWEALNATGKIDTAAFVLYLTNVDMFVKVHLKYVCVHADISSSWLRVISSNNWGKSFIDSMFLFNTAF